ncbi:phosphonopyruvate decarboxylase [Fibrobacter sp. UWB15]|uniref:phosphonopyruvate decarboxylase n=1 Tax=unclassified Fibrobacter TaxID=2634177 RepID=UPI00091F8D79|nr:MULTISPECIES: phosphonopyruvate decarboxylase [unclassified Fibrobacter]PWJ66405.1 phosphonopyruvate decarboxylase [Fibrobacter sp. UWB6]SHG04654.1 phosphonopyruvate decarboxylase [Fibrobacter sp. UWB8]SMG21209.1 phosphonopyruvate decarboxylase [Fibrobacter sp. UWB15]
MISPKFFIDTLGSYGIDFFAGVPDSLLKNICAYIADNKDAKHNVIAANEGAAVGLAAGYHLATGKIGVVYMQNSGEGNIINPLASLTDKEVYNIPALLLIGWRGRPGVHDEPQHVKQGKVTTGILNTMGVNYDVLCKEEDKAAKQIAKAVKTMKETGEVYALVIEKDTFEDYKLQSVEKNDLTMSREEAIQTVAAVLEPKDVIVSTTGMISRELFEYRAQKGEGHERDFLTVGSMGHASQIALGIAMEKDDRRVWCFDGDGATIMHMGSMAIVANKSPANYVHVVFNNGAHDSVGGQPTVGLKIDLPAVAKAVGYKDALTADSKESLADALGKVRNIEGPVLLEVKVKKGNRKDLGRPTTTPIENKNALMEFLRK